MRLLLFRSNKQKFDYLKSSINGNWPFFSSPGPVARIALCQTDKSDKGRCYHDIIRPHTLEVHAYQFSMYEYFRVKLLAFITDYKGIVSAESGGKEPAGFELVPEKVQVIRAEFRQQMLRTGIEMTKANKTREWLESHMGVPSPTCCVSSYTDYMKVSIQSQFNNRALSECSSRVCRSEGEEEEGVRGLVDC